MIPEERIRAVIISKLHPDRMKVSPRFTAVLSCMLDEDWTDPKIVELCITSDGGLLARHDGDIGFNDFIGAESDLIRNLEGVAKAADLAPLELDFLLKKARALRV